MPALFSCILCISRCVLRPRTLTSPRLISLGISVIGTQRFKHAGGVHGSEREPSVRGNAVGIYATINRQSINWGLRHGGKPCRRISRRIKSRAAMVRTTNERCEQRVWMYLVTALLHDPERDTHEILSSAGNALRCRMILHVLRLRNSLGIYRVSAISLPKTLLSYVPRAAAPINVTACWERSPLSQCTRCVSASASLEIQRLSTSSLLKTLAVGVRLANRSGVSVSILTLTHVPCGGRMC